MLSCQRHLFDIPDHVAYLNTAYMSPLLKTVVDNIEAGTRRKSRPWMLRVDDFYSEVDTARCLFGKIFNVPPSSIAVVPSASYGLSTAARNLSVAEGQRIIVIKNQFPSHTYPWRKIASEAGGHYVEVDIPLGEAATEYILKHMDDRTAIAALPNVLWTNGSYVDLLRIKERCNEIGAALVLDLTQSAGAMMTNLGEIRPDFAVVANYKWMLGPYSTGFLYVADQHFEGVPLEEGWITRKGSRDFSRLTENTDGFEPGAIRYDMGERANFALMPGVVAALQQLDDWQVGRIERTLASRNQNLCTRLTDLGLSTTQSQNRGPHFIAAKLPAGSRPELLAELAKRDVFISERNGFLRITPHLWNTERDFQALHQALAELL